MITSIHLSTLRNLEHFQVMSNVLSYLKSENLEELKLADFAGTFESRLKAYDEVLVLERGHVLSEKLSAADAERDLALRSLLSIIKTYCSFPESAKSDAALQLVHVIEKYGKRVDKLPYLEETGVLKNMLQDLSLEANQSAIALLHLDDWVEKLRSSALAFEELFTAREADNSTKLSGKVKEARRLVQESFEQLALLVNAFELVYGAELYASLSHKVNEAVDYARSQAARRGSRGSEGQSEFEPESASDAPEA